jgi:hypothetical protein
MVYALRIVLDLRQRASNHIEHGEGKAGSTARKA